ncbi:hypothetical protein LTR85_007441 [Meristemomyces frigidus]|nr:hypothetical protein LTR85_007441 [Meristemomyces frigidus]
MLRAHAQPLLARTSRRTAQRTGTGALTSHQCRAQLQCLTRRAFTSSSRRQDDRPAPSEHQRSTTHDDISSLLDSALDFDKGTPTAPATRTSRFKSNSTHASHPPSRGAAAGMGGAESYRPREGSSVDDLWAAMGGDSGGRTPQRGGSSSASAFPDISRMLDPLSTNRNNPRAVNNGPPSLAPPEKSLGIKLNASVGRRVDVNLNTMDPARAFRTLEAQCARNSVRKDFQRQRFHERPGLKRKRLKGERWRRRFREGFRGVVQLVQKMKRQGW